MKDWKPFFNRLYPIEVNVARHTIVMELVHGIDRCLRDPYNYSKQHPAFPGFKATISEAMLPFFVGQVKVSKKYKVDEGNTLELLVYAFREYMQLLSVKRICTPMLSDRTLENGFEAAIGSQSFKHDAAAPTLVGAFDMACQNEALMQTALMSLYVIPALLKPSDWGTVNLDGTDQLRSTLYQNAHLHTKRKLMFGGLLGGEYLVKAVRESVEGSLYNPNEPVNYSIIECLRPYGNIPGQYLTSEDEAFRDAIKTAYEKL